jgi:hypothetical protein
LDVAGRGQRTRLHRENGRVLLGAAAVNWWLMPMCEGFGPLDLDHNNPQQTKSLHKTHTFNFKLN